MVAQPNSSASRSAATYILHCWSVWASVSSVSSSLPQRNFMPRLIPVQHVLRFDAGDLLHRGVERRLTEPLLENARGIEKFVGDDGVEHAHAAFVEHTHNGLALLELAPDASAQFLIGGGERDALQVRDLAFIVRDRAGGQPLAQSALEVRVGKLLAPERAVTDARL